MISTRNVLSGILEVLLFLRFTLGQARFGLQIDLRMRKCWRQLAAELR